MKNIFLKFNMVLIFLIILFANFMCVVHAANQFDEGIEAVQYMPGNEDGIEYDEYRINVKEGQAGTYFIYAKGEETWIKIETDGANKLEWSGNSIQSFTLSDDLNYYIKYSYKSELVIVKASNADAETSDIDLSTISNTTTVNLTDISQAGNVEKAFSVYFLDFGDYAQNFLRKIFGEDITIDKIVFNKVNMLNANFFDDTTNPAANNASAIVKRMINKWFGYFKSLALVVIMVSIVAAGIRILLQTPQAKVKGYESLKKVVLAIALIFFFPYVMKFSFEINEAIITYICNADTYGYVSAVNISPNSNAGEEDIEFRSPKYVSTEGKVSSSYSIETTETYLRNIDEYERNKDIMRMIRAFAGVTYRFVYVVLWYIMLAQLYALAFIYVKRYLTIALLIIVYPLTIIGYVIDGVTGKRKGAFNTWSSKFFSSVFLQTLHAVMFGIISGILVNQVLKSGDGTVGSQKINVILMIVATSFLFSGEKILTKFWKASTSADRQGLKQAIGMPRQIMRTFKGK